MKIVVIGGTGLIGSKLVAKLRDQGHEVVAAAPNSGVNTITGEGVDEALKGAAVVVDVSNSPSLEGEPALAFFEASTRNLLAAEAKAGVKHHVALSVVGTDRLSGSGYFRAKIAQEKLITGSKILKAQNDPREVVTDPSARYYGVVLTERMLVPDDGAKLGAIRFEDWLSQPVAQR
jgi:uncharacterized protein YbjT (DUF2867 family)